jgi:hypothetical protein
MPNSKPYLQALTRYINGLPIDEAKKDNILNAINSIEYDPGYIGEFTGNTFEGPNKEYNQVKDKIDAYLKYGYAELNGGRRTRKHRKPRKPRKKRTMRNRTKRK